MKLPMQYRPDTSARPRPVPKVPVAPELTTPPPPPETALLLKLSPRLPLVRY